MNEACTKGDLETVKKLGLPEDSKAITYAALNGHMDIIAYLVSINSPININEIYSTFKTRHLDIVNFIWNVSCKNGYLETVKKLGLPKNSQALDYAADYGHLNLVKYLVSIGAPIDEWVFASAANKGHLDILKYLVSINAPMNLYAIVFASINGRLDTVKYLVSIGAPIDNVAIDDSFWRGQQEIVKYLLWNGAPYNTDVTSLKKELRLEFEPVVSEFIGPDLTGLILQNLI